MNTQFGSLYHLVGRNAPLTIGVILMLFWSAFCCLASIIGSLPLGDSAGILLFGHTVGNISRYWDPFLVGAFATSVIYLSSKIPPDSDKWNKEANGAISAVFGAVIFELVFCIVIAGNYGAIFQKIGCSKGYPSALTIILLTPFGMRGAILSTAMSLIVLYFERGPVPAILFVALVYFGKWANWWVVNITRYGFTGAKNALKPSSVVAMMVQKS